MLIFQEIFMVFIPDTTSWAEFFFHTMYCGSRSFEFLALGHRKLVTAVIVRVFRMAFDPM